MSSFVYSIRQPSQYHGNRLPLLSLACLLLPATLNGQALQGVVPETGLRYWEWQGEGVLFRLTQRLPDQTRAFFLARGFTAGDTDYVAHKCVFQTLFKNTEPAGGANIHYDLEEWKIHAPGNRSRLLTRERWNATWETRGVAQPARIAFEWALLPTRQVYQPEDYNWGMTSFGLEPGTRFDLEFSWERDGIRQQARLADIQCPDDIHPEPSQ